MSEAGSSSSSSSSRSSRERAQQATVPADQVGEDPHQVPKTEAELLGKLREGSIAHQWTGNKYQQMWIQLSDDNTHLSIIDSHHKRDWTLHKQNPFLTPFAMLPHTLFCCEFIAIAFGEEAAKIGKTRKLPSYSPTLHVDINYEAIKPFEMSHRVALDGHFTFVFEDIWKFNTWKEGLIKLMEVARRDFDLNPMLVMEQRLWLIGDGAGSGVVDEKELRGALKIANIKLKENQFEELWNRVDSEQQRVLVNPQFKVFLNMVRHNVVFEELWHKYTGPEEKSRMNVDQFRRFMLEEQKENLDRDECFDLMQAHYRAYNRKAGFDKQMFADFCSLSLVNKAFDDNIVMEEDMSLPFSNYYVMTAAFAGNWKPRFRDSIIYMLECGVRCLHLPLTEDSEGDPIVVRNFSDTMGKSAMPVMDFCELILDCAFQISNNPLVLVFHFEPKSTLADEEFQLRLADEIATGLVDTEVLSADPHALPSPKSNEGKVLITFVQAGNIIPELEELAYFKPILFSHELTSELDLLNTQGPTEVAIETEHKEVLVSIRLQSVQKKLKEQEGQGGGGGAEAQDSARDGKLPKSPPLQYMGSISSPSGSLLRLPPGGGAGGGGAGATVASAGQLQGFGSAGSFRGVGTDGLPLSPHGSLRLRPARAFPFRQVTQVAMSFCKWNDIKKNSGPLFTKDADNPVKDPSAIPPLLWSQGVQFVCVNLGISDLDRQIATARFCAFPGCRGVGHGYKLKPWTLRPPLNDSHPLFKEEFLDLDGQLNRSGSSGHSQLMLPDIPVLSSSPDVGAARRQTGAAAASPAIMGKKRSSAHLFGLDRRNSAGRGRSLAPVASRSRIMSTETDESGGDAGGEGADGGGGGVGGVGGKAKPKKKDEDELSEDEEGEATGPPDEDRPKHEQCGACTLYVKIISGHNIPQQDDDDEEQDSSMLLSLGGKLGSIFEKGHVANPYCVVRIDGIPEDRGANQTKVVMGNGFCPQWDERLEFAILEKEHAILSFLIYDRDEKGKKGQIFSSLTSTFVGKKKEEKVADKAADRFICGCSIPVPWLREGYRVVPLYGPKGQPFPERPSLFCHFNEQPFGNTVQLIAELERMTHHRHEYHRLKHQMEASLKLKREQLRKSVVRANDRKKEADETTAQLQDIQGKYCVCNTGTFSCSIM